jgi:hypothetical protein
LQADLVAFATLLQAGDEDNVLSTTHFGRMPRRVWDELVLLAVATAMCVFQLHQIRGKTDSAKSTHPSPGCRLLSRLEFLMRFRNLDAAQVAEQLLLSTYLDHLAVVCEIFGATPITAEDLITSHCLGPAPRPGSVAAEYLEFVSRKQSKDRYARRFGYWEEKVSESSGLPRPPESAHGGEEESPDPVNVSAAGAQRQERLIVAIAQGAPSA